jgi:hypothetical protein
MMLVLSIEFHIPSYLLRCNLGRYSSRGPEPWSQWSSAQDLALGQALSKTLQKLCVAKPLPKLCSDSLVNAIMTYNL